MAHVNEFPSNESTSSFQKYSKENRQQRIRKLADCRIYAGSHVRRQLSPRKSNSWRFSDDEGWELDAQIRFWDGHTALNCLREATPIQYSPRGPAARARAHPGAISDWRGGHNAQRGDVPLLPHGRNRAPWLPDDVRSHIGGGPIQHPWRPDRPALPTASLISPRLVLPAALPQLSPRPMLSMAEANEQAIREGFSAAWPDGMRPTVRPTMPTKQPLASVKPVPQASPRGQAAILSEKQKLALIKDTRNMIERHHKTMHEAFLAMDKARSRPTPLACLKPGPCPNHPTLSKGPCLLATPLRLMPKVPMPGIPTTAADRQSRARPTPAPSPVLARAPPPAYPYLNPGPQWAPR